jgi:hypothetical protein
MSLTALGSSLVLAASLALPVSAATAAGPSSGRLIATGTVANTRGGAAPGAVVRLYAWPSDQVLQHFRPGQVVPRTLLATTTASSAGSYSFRVSSAALRSAAASGGYANLEADSGMATWFFTRKASGAAPIIHVNLSGAAPARHCSGWVFQYQVKPAWGVVGQGYVWSRATGVNVDFTYSRGQSSTLGIGASPSGKAGSFKAAGSETQTKTGTEGMPGFKIGNVLWRTKWRMAKYEVTCARVLKSPASGVTRGRWHCKNGVCTKWQVRSDGWKSGSDELHPKKAPHTPSFDCTSFQGGPNSYFQTSSERAVTWSGGLSVPVLNFDAEAQTGYDTSAQLTFYFHKTRLMCGTDAAPPYAQQLVAERG